MSRCRLWLGDHHDLLETSLHLWIEVAGFDRIGDQRVGDGLQAIDQLLASERANESGLEALEDGSRELLEPLAERG